MSAGVPPNEQCRAPDRNYHSSGIGHAREKRQRTVETQPHEGLVKNLRQLDLFNVSFFGSKLTLLDCLGGSVELQNPSSRCGSETTTPAMYYDQSLHFYGQVQQPIGLAPSPSDYNYLPSLITSVLKNASTATRTRTTTTHPGRCSLSYHADDLFSVWNPFDQSPVRSHGLLQVFALPHSVLIDPHHWLRRSLQAYPPTGHPAQVDQPNSDQTVQTNLHHQIGSDSRRLSHPVSLLVDSLYSIWLVGSSRVSLQHTSLSQPALCDSITPHLTPALPTIIY
ncbi:hypothetical protein H4Q26_002652 [Puccinia striiformis f. sp. tritici PST-130]|nr:hypothetical protein H4Q26_002652 [Puccinia striiformis f. sp. tritici PST-130]